MLDRAEAVYAAIAHGDDDHRRWLKEALTAHFLGSPIPPAYGKGTKEALQERIKDLESQLKRASMLFPMLIEAAEKGELLLICGGICVWHHCEDNKIVIKVIVATRQGAGSELLSQIKIIAYQRKASGLLVKCPIDLKSNDWYAKKGFELVSTEGRLNVWWLPLAQGG